MNILATGCAGFIGSHFVEESISCGDSIVGVDSLTYAGKLSNMINFQDSIHFYKENICNTAEILKIVKNHNTEWIVNFAAETHVDNSIQSCDEFIKTNIFGVKSLLDICKETGTKLMQISTDEVYGTASDRSFLETDVLSPGNPYSATKAAAEHLVTSYANTYGIVYLIARPSNNFGPRQHAEKLIPTIFKSVLSDKKVPIYGSGNNIRDWLFVKDTAKIIRKIIDSGTINNAYNVTASNEMPNVNIIKKILSMCNKDFDDSTMFIKDRLGHDFRYSIDNRKLLEIVNDSIFSNFDEALRETYEFYMSEKSL